MHCYIAVVGVCRSFHNFVESRLPSQYNIRDVQLAQSMVGIWTFQLHPQLHIYICNDVVCCGCSQTRQIHLIERRDPRLRYLPSHVRCRRAFSTPGRVQRIGLVHFRNLQRRMLICVYPKCPGQSPDKGDRRTCCVLRPQGNSKKICWTVGSGQAAKNCQGCLGVATQKAETRFSGRRYMKCRVTLWHGRTLACEATRGQGVTQALQSITVPHRPSGACTR